MDMMELRFRMMSMMGGGKVLKIEAGTYTPESDVVAKDTHISHSLGAVPDFVIAIAEAFTPDASSQTRYIAESYFSKEYVNFSNGTGYRAFYVTTFVGRDTPWMSHEQLSTSKFLHENNFEIPYYNSGDILKSGVTYHYVVGKYE